MVSAGIAVAIAVSGGTYWAVAHNQGIPRSGDVVVPNVVGDDGSQALSELHRAGLHGRVTSMQVSTTVAKGIVMQQYPAAGFTEPAGTLVLLTTSWGPKGSFG